MANIIVLGAGMVGSAIALDLAENHSVVVIDIDKNNLDNLNKKSNSIRTKIINVAEKELLQNYINDFDLVVNAVPGFLGYETLKSVIEAEKDVVDIAFSPENTLELSSLAKEKGVTAVVDCGVAPGMDNLILGYYNEILKITNFECLVGGLPKIKKWPFNYKAPFSPVDVIEEYTRPARYVENSELITREALTDCEYVEFENVGSLESFNSDGLRSIIFTMSHIPNMKEKTLRYPGHVEYIKVLRESGFFDKQTIEIDGNMISPLAVTSKILFNEWKLGEEEEEFTVMRVKIKGENSKGENEEIIYDLYDEYCTETKISSMARTTGYTASAVANMVLDGHFSDKGVFPPELIGKDKECFEYILTYLEKRNVIYKKSAHLSEH